MPATEHFFRDQKKLHIVFAVSCVALLAGVFGMMVEDYADAWRGIQSKNFELQAAAKARDIAEMKAAEQFQAEKQRLESSIRKTEEELEPFKDLQASLEKELDSAVRLVEALALQLKSENANRDEARADYDLAIRDGLPQSVLESRRTGYEEAQATCDATQLKLEEAQLSLDQIGDPDAAEDDEAKAALTTLRDKQQELDQYNKDYEKLQADVVLAENALTLIKPDDFWMKAKRWSMQLPILEGFNGPLRVKQDWLPDLHQTLGMTAIARFDRCRTCHMNMDKTVAGGLPAFPHGTPSDEEDVHNWVAEGKFPHPFSTHPNTDLFVTASSPHPVSTFGCTICHDGQGSGTSFGNAEHSPNDPHQQEEWHHEFGYHPNHFWEYPMQPNRFQESTCIKCHHQVVELGVNPEFGASAPKVSKGYSLIRKYGCFGCHEIHGFDGGLAIGPDIRLEPQTDDQRKRVAEDPSQVAGKFRKVGPSLRHLSAKTTEEFVAFWTQNPQGFRPTTKMPRFFGVHDHLNDEQVAETKQFEDVELVGLAKVLVGNSEAIDLLEPTEGYQADAARGKNLFRERGCLACHSHKDVEGSNADFGPNITDIHEKIRRNADDNSFSDWLYTWIKEPTRYHARTRMPNVFLEPYKDGDTDIDPAADIVAYLLSFGDAKQFPSLDATDEAIDELVTLYLKKSRYSDAAVAKFLSDRAIPEEIGASGDERVLVVPDGEPTPDDAVWKDRKLRYIGMRSVARYGCYGCHDIPGYEDARPIGVALQDWGRKDTSKLGLEHIEEFLHHHGEPDHSSTLDRVENAMSMAKDGTHSSEELEPELTQAYFYNSLLHHGRPGFIWQKLRGPRTYDFKKTETKGYDERLRMPKFPLKEDEVEAIATFVLGLVADPPSEKYIYNPGVEKKTRVEGEFLLAKYNCTGCHMMDLPKFSFGVNLEEDVFPTKWTDQDHKSAEDLLLSMHRPRKVLTGETRKFVVDGEEVELPVASFHGMEMVAVDPEEDPEFQERTVVTWETIDFADDDSMRNLPGSNIPILEAKFVEKTPARGGAFAEFLVETLVKRAPKSKQRDPAVRSGAWGQVPPPLYQEGQKVQTAWMHKFLLNPETLRHATILRMPKFNMSAEEASTLANYFAAVDGSPFPFNEQLPTSDDYIAQRTEQLRSANLLKPNEEYLDQAWQTLNGLSDGLHSPTVLENGKCVGCHSVGGLEYSPKPGDTTPQGPDLRRVQERLRPDWVKLWLYNPKWTTPYTAMPNNFTADSGADATKTPPRAAKMPTLFSGDPDAQVIGVRDALMNYAKLIEKYGIPVKGQPKPAADAKEAAE